VFAARLLGISPKVLASGSGEIALSADLSLFPSRSGGTGGGGTLRSSFLVLFGPGALKEFHLLTLTRSIDVRVAYPLLLCLWPACRGQAKGGTFLSCRRSSDAKTPQTLLWPGRPTLLCGLRASSLCDLCVRFFPSGILLASLQCAPL